MTIIDFLLPKWRHSKPDIRLAAVREMTAEKMDTLERIALTDPDAEVRTEAIQRIEDTARLERIAAAVSDEAVGKAAEDRLNRLRHDRLIDADDRRERFALLEKLTDEERLAAIAADVDDPDIRMAALARVTRPALLCKVAERHCGPAVGREVVIRLDDPELLKRLTRNASNKKVRKQAEAKLGVLDRRDDPEAASGGALKNACEQLEALLADGNWTGYPAALAEAAATWRTHDPQGIHPLRERFEQAADAVEGQLKVFQRKGEVQSALENLCTGAEALAEGTRSEAPSPEAVRERIEDLRNRWDAIDHGVAPPTLYETLSSRFQAACRRAVAESDRLRVEQADAARRRQERFDELTRLCSEAEALAETGPRCEAGDSPEWQSLMIRWREAAAGEPEETALKNRFESALQRHRDAVDAAAREAAEKAQQQESRLRALCEQVEAAVEAEDRPGLEKTVRAAQAGWKTTGDRAPEVKAALSDRFQAACDRFFQVQREFWEKTEWEWFANLTRKEELCVIVEALAEKEGLDGLPQLVREVQNRWKTIGPVGREKAEPVWTRFRSACDRAYARCLAEKERLAADVRDLVEGTPTPEGFENPADWEAVSDAIKMIQAQWKAIGPLPRSMEKPLFEAFQAHCNKFFERRRCFYQALDANRKKNLSDKSALCQEAESLSFSKDWAATAGRLKELQRRWKTTGPAPKEESDRLWRRFQSACHRFFERLEAAKPDHLAQKLALCDRVETLSASVSDENLKETARQIMAIQEEWKAVGPVPEEEVASVWERFRIPCDRFFDRYRDHVREIHARQQAHQEQKASLAAEAESLTGSEEWKETGDQLKALQKQWQEIGPAPRKIEQALWRRFRSACDAFFQRRNDFFDSLDRKRSINLEKKEEICLRLEVLAQLTSLDPSPAEAADRAAERLRIGLEYKNGVIVPGDRKTTWENALKTVRRLQAEWKELGPVRGEAERRLQQRCRRATGLFFSPKSQSTQFVLPQEPFEG